MSHFFLLIVLLGNLWIWKILAFNIFLALLVAITSISLYLLLQRKSQKLTVAFGALFLILLFFQLRTTSVQDLTYLDNDQQRLQQERLRQYPPVYLKLGDKTLWIPIAHWFEGRNESIAFFRILNNFSEVVDPNLYFFANHPRERVGFTEFEKFPYILLPIFLLGLFFVVKKHGRNYALLASFLAPILFTSILGHKNPLGPISIFPFMAITTTFGFKSALKWTQSLSASYKKALIFGFVILFVLVFLQTIAYAIY